MNVLYSTEKCVDCFRLHPYPVVTGQLGRGIAAHSGWLSLVGQQRHYPCTTLPCHAMPFSAIHCTALPCTILLCHAAHCYAMHCHALPCTTLICYSLHCSDMNYTALACSTLLCHAPHCSAMHHTALLYTTLLCHALLCSAMHHTTKTSVSPCVQTAPHVGEVHLLLLRVRQ